MPRGVIPIRGSEEEHNLWKEASALAGLRFSAWARMMLNEEAAKVKAEHSDEQVAKVQRQVVMQTAFPQQGKKTYEPDFR